MESLRAFSGNIVAAIEKASSMKQAVLRYEPSVREACKDLTSMAQNAYRFVDKVDELFWYSQNEARLERVTTAIEYKDFDPLIDFISDLQSCLRDAGNLHREFYEASREASCSCVQAADNCRYKYNYAKRDKMKTASAVAGIFTFGSVVAGTAIVTTAVVVTHVKGNLPVMCMRN